MQEGLLDEAGLGHAQKLFPFGLGNVVGVMRVGLDGPDANRLLGVGPVLLNLHPLRGEVVPLAEPMGEDVDTGPQRGDEELRQRHGLVRSVFFFGLVGSDLMPTAFGLKKKILLQIHFHFHDSLSPSRRLKILIGHR
jgi:hypothetical protein